MFWTLSTFMQNRENKVFDFTPLSPTPVISFLHRHIDPVYQERPLVVGYRESF